MPASCRASSTPAARMGWDVPVVGQTTLGSGQTKALLEKPEYWNKVYSNNFRKCCYVNGKLAPKTQEYVDRLKAAKIEFADTLLWWVALGWDGVQADGRHFQERRHQVRRHRRSYMNKVKGWPGVYGTVTWTPEQHNGFPDSEVVMCEVNSLKDGAFKRMRAGLCRSSYSVRPIPDGMSSPCASIVSYGLAVGAVYALIGITYNVMYSASRVFSFTAGMLGMLGGVLGALFIQRMGMNAVLGFVLVLACGAVLGLVTEIVTVRPVLKSIEQHLYVLSTLAFALMIQQVTAIEWGTEAQPFPPLFPPAEGWLDQKFWLPLLACAVTIGGLEFLYRKTLIGRAFLAIAEDSYAARALGLPETRLRIASFALAGMIGTLAGFTGAQMLLAFFGNQSILNFYGFVPVALGGMGSNRGAVIGGLALGLFQQAANFLVGGIFAAVAVFAVFIVVLLLRPEGLAGAATARRV